MHDAIVLSVSIYTPAWPNHSAKKTPLSLSPFLSFPSVDMFLTNLFLFSSIALSYVSAAPTCDQAPQPAGDTAVNASQHGFASAWYPGWDAATYPPSSVSWSKYSALTFAFAYVFFALILCMLLSNGLILCGQCNHLR